MFHSSQCLPILDYIINRCLAAKQDLQTCFRVFLQFYMFFRKLAKHFSACSTGFLLLLEALPASCGSKDLANIVNVDGTAKASANTPRCSGRCFGGVPWVLLITAFGFHWALWRWLWYGFGSHKACRFGKQINIMARI